MVKKLWTTLVCGIFYSRSLGACEKHRRKKSVATFRGHYVPCNVFHSIEKKNWRGSFAYRKQHARGWLRRV